MIETFKIDDPALPACARRPAVNRRAPAETNNLALMLRMRRATCELRRDGRTICIPLSEIEPFVHQGWQLPRSAAEALTSGVDPNCASGLDYVFADSTPPTDPYIGAAVFYENHRIVIHLRQRVV